MEYESEDSSSGRLEHLDADYPISRAMSILAKAAMLDVKAERVRDSITPEEERDQNSHYVASLGVLGALSTLGTFYRPAVNKVRSVHADYLEVRANRLRNLVPTYTPTAQN